MAQYDFPIDPERRKMLEDQQKRESRKACLFLLLILLGIFLFGLGIWDASNRPHPVSDIDPEALDQISEGGWYHR